MRRSNLIGRTVHLRFNCKMKGLVYAQHPNGKTVKIDFFDKTLPRDVSWWTCDCVVV